MVENKGPVVEMVPSEGNKVFFRGEEYRLKRAVLHGPSEHRVEADYYDLEIQLHHESTDGKKLSLAIMVAEGAHNMALERVVAAMPKVVGQTRNLTGVDLRQLIPKIKTYYLYTGSYTAPPCKEGVQWLVLKRPISVDSLTITNFQNLFPGSKRDLQELNGRMILHN